jgi:hypothetical protein
MSTLFHKPVLAKLVDYATPKLGEINIWLWIVEYRRAEQVYDIVRKLQLEYAVSESHYIVAPMEGAYNPEYAIPVLYGHDYNHLYCVLVQY